MRRLIVGGVVSSVTLVPLVSFIRPAFAAPVPNADVDANARRVFSDVSRYLTGQAVLDETQSSRLLQALTDDDASFNDACRQLAAYLTANKPDPLHLQAELDAAKLAFAALPRRIVTAWYVGVVGDGSHARALTYSTSLMYRTVEDRLRPPSYAYGGYGSWRVDPRSVRLAPLVATASARA
nr:sugar dehydrogenase complex small subunit [Caballeronia insecticola]